MQMRIELESETHPNMGPIYKLSRAELGELKRQVNELLSKGLIRPSISPLGSPVLFTTKKDGGLRMRIDYRARKKRNIKKCRITD